VAFSIEVAKDKSLISFKRNSHAKMAADSRDAVGGLIKKPVERFVNVFIYFGAQPCNQGAHGVPTSKKCPNPGRSKRVMQFLGMSLRLLVILRLGLGLCGLPPIVDALLAQLGADGPKGVEHTDRMHLILPPIMAA
jgi:hypothetical protein